MISRKLKELLSNEEIEIFEGSSLIPAVCIQKKYDGMRCVLEYDNGKFKMFSDTGLWIEKQFPSLLEWVEKKKWPTQRWILDAETEAWKDGKHQPRELIAAAVHEKQVVEKGTFVVNVFDCLYFDGDIHKKTQRERLKYLDKFDFGQSTIGVPEVSIPMNKAPTFYPKDEDEVRKCALKCINSPGSEGAMVKLLDGPNSIYPLTGTTTGVVKLKTFAELHVIVLKRNPTKVSPQTFNYEIGVRFTSQDKIPKKYQWELNGKVYHHVGRTYNVKLKAEPGEILTVRFHTMNYYRDPETGEERIHLYEPAVSEKWIFAKEPDFFQTALKIGRDSGLLVKKEEVKQLDLIYPVKGELLRNFLPVFRRGELYDQGFVELDEIPKGISPGRFIWFQIGEKE